MKKIIPFLTFLAFSLLLQTTADGQTKKKAEVAFLKELNNVLKNSEEQHWRYNGVKRIDSAFAINNGILSVSVSYTDEDSSIIRTRMEAPVNKIYKVLYDLYLILEYKSDEVTAYESKADSNELVEYQKTNYFHIGAPLPENMERQEKLQKLLDNLMKNYKN